MVLMVYAASKGSRSNCLLADMKQIGQATKVIRHVGLSSHLKSLYGVNMALYSVVATILPLESYVMQATIIHDYFIAITFAGSLGRYLNTRPNGLVFKQLLRDPANVNVWKTKGDPYIDSISRRWINVLFLLWYCYYNIVLDVYLGSS